MSTSSFSNFNELFVGPVGATGPAGALTLDELIDVDLGSPGPVDGYVLTYDTSSPTGWIAAAPTGGGGATKLCDLIDVNISCIDDGSGGSGGSGGGGTFPDDGDVLTYDASSPSGWIAMPPSGGSGGTVQGTDGNTFNIEAANDAGEDVSITNRGEYSVDLQTRRFGSNAVAAAESSVIVGGYNNRIDSNSIRSSILGGYDNEIRSSSVYSNIGGGFGNDIAAAESSVICGGEYNNISSFSDGAFIGGGHGNDVRGDQNSVVGGKENDISASGSKNCSILGGEYNTIDFVGNANGYSTILGGKGNDSRDDYCVVMGEGGVANNNLEFAIGASDASNYPTFNTRATANTIVLTKDLQTTTPTKLATDGYKGGTQQWTPFTNAGAQIAGTFTGLVNAYHNGGTLSDMAAWKIEGWWFYKATSMEFGYTSTILRQSDDSPAWSISMGTWNGGTEIYIEVTGPPDKVFWIARIDAVGSGGSGL